MRQTAVVAPTVPLRPEEKIPDARFTDITQASGIAFVHNNGAYGDKLLPETMGGGVAFFDADGDGDQDLLFVNGTYWPNKTPAGKTPPPTLVLYLNDGGGKFADVTMGSGLEKKSFYGMGVACGDFDNDGRVDLFATGVGGYSLFRNLGGGKFEDVTEKAGVGGAKEDWGTSAAFIDYDNDGKLDLFVCNYIRWSPEIDREVGYSLTGIGRAYGPPTNFRGAFSRLYHNDGGGKFSDVSAAAGVQMNNSNSALNVPAGKSLGVAPVDLDADGFVDLVVANDTVQNFVFHNSGGDTFKEIGAEVGIAFDSYGNTRGAMGIDTARHRNDGSLAIGIGNFANEMIAFYVSRGGEGGGGEGGGMLFTDDAIPEGVGPASRLLLKFGLFFFDYDLDGWEDLLTANGHLEEEINKVQASQQYAQPAQLFWNGGKIDAGFVPVPPTKAGSELFKKIVGRGSAFADIDGDGDQDVVLTQIAGPPLLLRNDQKLSNHFVRLKLIGKRANRDAIGAVIRLKLGDQTLTRQVMPTRSYLSQSELPVTIGLGPAAKSDSIEIVWPGGAVQKLAPADVKLDALTVIEQTK
ncbi:MAG: enediyne biosynthesis protein [Phycisphaerales bacterium]|nr:enediyne biosynthesis protein [Phycisphaerales bacterium]